MQDSDSKQKRRKVMQSIRSRNTKPEIRVRLLLHSLGFRFRLHRKDLPGSPDIVLPKYRTVIFVNGCFWHQHPECKYSKQPKSNLEYWERKLKNNVLRDERNIRNLQALGWKTLVVWECETIDLDNLREILLLHFGT